MLIRPVPELLAPAGSLDAARAAIANGADSVYLGASRFNARDEGAQLSLDELGEACRLAHGRSARIYLTLNVLIKPGELADALMFLGEAIDRGIDAAIVQDIGLIRLIQGAYPDLEIHGSTQMTVHDASGAAVLRAMGVDRVVLARENTLDDLRAIHAAVPELGLETFTHGALCISYSGQCYMSGMISERSANRGSCAQSCRKDYVLRDERTGEELDRGYLISARDLAAHDHLAEIASAGIQCLKIEGRKKRPEYVATVTHAYREWINRLRELPEGESPSVVLPTADEVEPLVQIFSRGFTGGMYGGRPGRQYVTRTQPDNRGVLLGTVIGIERDELIVDLSEPVEIGDGLGFEAAGSSGGPTTGFSVGAVRPMSKPGRYRITMPPHVQVPAGARVVRTSDIGLLTRARSSYDSVIPIPVARVPLAARVVGTLGSTLKIVFVAEGDAVTVWSRAPLAAATRRPLDEPLLREQLGRLGATRFVLGSIDTSELEWNVFIPVSELNHLRQQATEALEAALDRRSSARIASRQAQIDAAIGGLDPVGASSDASSRGTLSAQVYTLNDARRAADAGATEICFDPFLRHPAPPRTGVRELAQSLSGRGIGFRLRTPTIIRPEDRPSVQRWLDLDLPILSGHLGLVAELGGAGRDVIADYAVNVFNQHSAAELFRLGARRIVLSIELTTREIAAVTAPWDGRGFDVVLYGRPEGMTLEHCVLSAAFDREVTTCRDLCVQKHPNVQLTDPAGYSFPVATDHACRNRLLHSRPVDGSEFLPELTRAGIRNFHLLFNVEGDDVGAIVSAYRAAIDAAIDAPSEGDRETAGVRAAVGSAFTRGHFARAV